jgi:hypothetical protein
MLAQDSAAEGIDLAESDGAHPGSLKSEGESADAGKQVEYIHRTTRSLIAAATRIDNHGADTRTASSKSHRVECSSGHRMQPWSQHSPEPWQSHKEDCTSD